jgi:hypothetical protein
VRANLTIKVSLKSTNFRDYDTGRINVMATLLERLGIKLNLTMAFNPQANGQTERANQEVEKHLRFYVA